MQGPSYYDILGNLVLCDAIDSLDGIKFRPTVGPNLPKTQEGAYEALKLNIALPAAYPPVVQKTSKTKPVAAQHHYLNHTPPAHTATPSTSLSYAQSIRGSLQQFSAAHKPERGVAASQLGGNRSQTNSGTAARARLLSQSNLGVKSSATAARILATSVAISNPRDNSAANSNSGSNQNYRQSNSNHGHQYPPGQYRTEECPVCHRTFKGPKASTHKQQHIRRLHPSDYMPKRGGKKKQVIG